jgi:hypothetical protein
MREVSDSMSINVKDFRWEKGVNDIKYIELLEKELSKKQSIINLLTRNRIISAIFIVISIGRQHICINQFTHSSTSYGAFHHDIPKN